VSAKLALSVPFACCRLSCFYEIVFLWTNKMMMMMKFWSQLLSTAQSPSTIAGDWETHHIMS